MNESEKYIQDVSNDFDEKIKMAERAKELVEAKNRLANNKDWKTLIEDGYVEDEAKRIFNAMLNTEGFMKKDSMDTMVSNLISVKHFKEYLLVIDVNGENIDEEIDNLKLAKTETLVQLNKAAQDRAIDAEIEE